MERRRSDHRAKWNQSHCVSSPPRRTSTHSCRVKTTATARFLPRAMLVSGGLAATIGPIATGPFDVAKTRLMAQSGPAPSSTIPCSSRSSGKGIMAMWKGLLPASCAFLGTSHHVLRRRQIVGLYTNQNLPEERLKNQTVGEEGRGAKSRRKTRFHLARRPSPTNEPFL